MIFWDDILDIISQRTTGEIVNRFRHLTRWITWHSKFMDRLRKTKDNRYLGEWLKYDKFWRWQHRRVLEMEAQRYDSSEE